MVYIGVDIGGTKVAAGLGDEKGNIFDTVRLPTPASADFSPVRDAIFAALHMLLDRNHGAGEKLAGIGLSCPGPLNIPEGKIVHVATTGWRDVPVCRMFEQEFGVPVRLENDASCAAYGEAVLGAGKGYDQVAYFTVSTGVGGGLCSNGQLYAGAHGLAADFGHIPVELDGPSCACGGRGCLQLFSSGTAIAEQAKKASAASPGSLLSGKEDLTSADVVAAVIAGDAVAAQVWDRAMTRLGFAAAMVHQIVDPGVIVFGGGVSQAWEIMLPPLAEAFRRHFFSDVQLEAKLVCSQLGEKAGFTGAVLLAAETGRPVMLGTLEERA